MIKDKRLYLKIVSVWSAIIMCCAGCGGDADAVAPTTTPEVSVENSAESIKSETTVENQSAEDATETKEEMQEEIREVVYQMDDKAFEAYLEFDYESEYMLDWLKEEFAYERDHWYTEYNGDKLQRISGEAGNHLAAQCPDIIFYQADSDEKVEDIALTMVRAMIDPLMEPAEGRLYTIKEYEIVDQSIVELGDGVWLLPYIDGYYRYEGTDFITWDHYVETTSTLEKNGLMPFVREGSIGAYTYVLIREGSVYRLQRANDMITGM